MGVVMERWCPTQQMLGVFLRRRDVKKLLLIGTAALLMVTSASAQVPDVFPYKEDGPERDYFLRTFVRTCTQVPYWKNLAANEKEATQFCECKALFTSDIWTREDDLEWERAKQGHTKLPAETYDKWQKASMACQKHLSKLPKAPARQKVGQEKQQ
jgi:hypothetical protein